MLWNGDVWGTFLYFLFYSTSEIRDPVKRFCYMFLFQDIQVGSWDVTLLVPIIRYVIFLDNSRSIIVKIILHFVEIS